MSCESCGCDPCGCQPSCFIDPCAPVNPNYQVCPSKCNLDKTNNIWYVPFQEGYDCKCKLDQMTYQQVVNILERVPYAARDLERITDDECLLTLAREVTLLVPEQEDDQKAMDRLNANSLPFYTLFHGNVPTPGPPRERPKRSR